jgi:uncharacterized membrane protein
MKKSIARIATVVWTIGLVLTAMMLSVPPANVPLYIGLACIAIIPVIFGSRRYRIFGVVALAFSLLLAVGEHNAGIKFQEKMRLLREKIERQYGNTNSPSASQNVTTTNK